MSREMFGTDGIRGLANTHPMTSEVALKVGMAAGRLFTKGSYRHRVVIGKDTRLSGYMIESALVGLERGVQIIRAHDVAETAQAVTIWHAIEAGARGLL